MTVLQQRQMCLRTLCRKREVKRAAVEESGREGDAVGNWKQVVVGTVVGMHWICSAVVPDVSLAVLNSPVASLPRTADAVLRRSIPAFNSDVQQIQRLMEGISYSLRIPQRKAWGSMQENVESAQQLAQDTSKMLQGVPEDKRDQAIAVLDEVLNKMGKLQLWIDEHDPEKVSVRVADVLTSVAELKLLQTPGLPYLVPRTYSDRPRLTGRAIVQLAIDNGSGNSELVEIALDGYSSPLSAGVFAANVASHAFDQQKLSVDRDSIVLRSKNGDMSDTLPLEILPVGQFEPLYRTELDVQTGEVPVLPLSIFGAVSLSHAPDTDEMSASDEAFIFKFNRSTAGLGGMAFDEGKFSVIGYVTKGLETINTLETGNTILRAEITRGQENLILPKRSSLST